MKRIFVLIVSGFIFIFTVNTLASTAAISHHRAVRSVSTHSVNKTVNINTATQSELESLKGLAEKKAAAIIGYRKEHGPFGSLNDLTNVTGIGSKMVARLEKNNPGRMIVKKQRGKKKS